MSPQDAEALFVARASRPVTDSERPHVAPICASLDHLPLAIELAAESPAGGPRHRSLHDARGGAANVGDPTIPENAGMQRPASPPAEWDAGAPGQ